MKQWIPEEMRHAVPELLRQTQELEWAYGEEAQSKLDAMTGQVLQTLEETEPEQRGRSWSPCWSRAGGRA